VPLQHLLNLLLQIGNEVGNFNKNKKKERKKKKERNIQRTQACVIVFRVSVRWRTLLECVNSPVKATSQRLLTGKL
jgi:hypothetical protein